LLFKNEERVKRLIEEVEHVKSEVRQKDRDLILTGDKI